MTLRLLMLLLRSWPNLAGSIGLLVMGLIVILVPHFSREERRFRPRASRKNRSIHEVPRGFRRGSSIEFRG